jgi:5-methylcytosine-specific restriction protein B
LPTNLWFIGTMNTTDRSIALVDAALRRRFYFAPFFSNQPPIEGLLSRWLERHSPEMTWVADLVDIANEKLGDRHMGVGPSYFMVGEGELDEGRIRRIWRRAVIPYIEEQFFGNEDRLAEFDFDRLKSEFPLGANGLAAMDVSPEDKDAGEAPLNGVGEDVPATSPEGERISAADANSPAA